MTEVADRAEAKAPYVVEPVARGTKRPATDRLTEPPWMDWCDSDR